MSDTNDLQPTAPDGDRTVPTWTAPELRETDIVADTRTSIVGGDDGSGGLS